MLGANPVPLMVISAPTHPGEGCADSEHVVVADGRDGMTDARRTAEAIEAARRMGFFIGGFYETAVWVNWKLTKLVSWWCSAH